MSIPSFILGAMFAYFTLAFNYVMYYVLKHDNERKDRNG